MKRLQGKNVLITGASSGFGRGIALVCAREGANVALVARSGQRLHEVEVAAREMGVEAANCLCDVGDEGQILAAIARAKTHLGPIDVLVNNAGTNVPSRSIRDTSAEEWRTLLEVNLTSAFLFTKALLPDMMARRHGTIINVASRAAIFPTLFPGVGYATSKIGMQSLTQITNEEGNPANVRACIINPGEGNTAILDRRAEPPDAESRLSMLQPEDMGEAVVFVATLPQRANVWRLDMMPTRKREVRP